MEERIALDELAKGKKDLQEVVKTNDIDKIVNLIKKKYVPKGKEFTNMYLVMGVGYMVSFHDKRLVR